MQHPLTTFSPQRHREHREEMAIATKRKNNIPVVLLKCVLLCKFVSVFISSAPTERCRIGMKNIPPTLTLPLGGGRVGRG
jgi:hypothetical protein